MVRHAVEAISWIRPSNADGCMAIEECLEVSKPLGRRSAASFIKCGLVHVFHACLPATQLRGVELRLRRVHCYGFRLMLFHTVSLPWRLFVSASTEGIDS